MLKPNTTFSLISTYYNLYMIKLESFFIHWKVRVRLFRYSKRSFIDKITTNNKYFKLYLYHEQVQQQQINNIIMEVEKQKEEQRYINRIKSMIRQYSFNSFKEKINKRKQQIADRYQKANLQQQTRSFMENVFFYMSLYYQSLQNLVEGRREVLNNQSFRFQDNQTVKDKQDKFQAAFARIIGKKSQDKEL